MAEAFALYLNDLELKDEDGNVLVLTPSNEGIYQSGSYYDYLKSVVEDSLNHFLADTTFTYTAQSSGFGGDGRGEHNGEFFGGKAEWGNRGELGGFPDGELPDGEFPDEGKLPGSGEFPDNGEFPGDGEGHFNHGFQDFAGGDGQAFQDGIQCNEGAGGLSLSGNYETAQDYINALNAERKWVSYNAASNTASITSVADFVLALKNASKSVGAFDSLNPTQGENILFGYGDGQGAHFDPVMSELLAGTEYGDAYASDLNSTDAQGNTVDVRMDMYNPMYYLSAYYDGYGSAQVASHWRIRSGIQQGDTALTTEVNLALALENYGADVDFETVWGQGHTQAERAGTSTENFIQWVGECMDV